MNRFEIELKKGNFVVSKCLKCNHIVWPPSDSCNKCFSQVDWKKISMEGKLLEFSKKDNIFFGIGEFDENIRIMATIKNNSKEPKIGDKVKLSDYKIQDNTHKFSIELF